MSEEIPVPKLDIITDSKASVKIAVMCGMLGAVVSTVSYLYIKGVAVATIDNANIALKEYFDQLKNQE
jgi:hypothetical protein